MKRKRTTTTTTQKQKKKKSAKETKSPPRQRRRPKKQVEDEDLPPKEEYSAMEVVLNSKLLMDCVLKYCKLHELKEIRVVSKKFQSLAFPHVLEHSRVSLLDRFYY